MVLGYQLEQNIVKMCSENRVVRWLATGLATAVALATMFGCGGAPNDHRPPFFESEVARNARLDRKADEWSDVMKAQCEHEGGTVVIWVHTGRFKACTAAPLPSENKEAVEMIITALEGAVTNGRVPAFCTSVEEAHRAGQLIREALAR